MTDQREIIDLHHLHKTCWRWCADDLVELLKPFWPMYWFNRTHAKIYIWTKINWFSLILWVRFFVLAIFIVVDINVGQLASVQFRLKLVHRAKYLLNFHGDSSPMLCDGSRNTSFSLLVCQSWLWTIGRMARDMSKAWGIGFETINLR